MKWRVNPKKTPKQTRLCWQEYIRKGVDFNILASYIQGVALEMKKFWGFNYSYHLSYGKGDLLYWCSDQRDNQKVGERAIKLYSVPSFRKKIIKELKRRYEIMNEWSDKMLAKDFSKMPLAELGALYRKTERATVEYAALTICIDGVDEVITARLSKMIDACVKNSRHNFNQVFDIITTPAIPSALSVRDREVLRLAIAVQNKKITRAEAKARLSKIAKHHWWEDLGWGMYDNETAAGLARILEEMLGAGYHAAGRLRELNNYGRAVAKKKKEIIKELGQNKNREFLKYIKIFEDFAVFHDWRKEFQMRAMFIEARLLKAIAIRLAIPFRILRWALPEEVARMIKGKHFNLSALSKRSKGYLVLVKQEKMEMFFGMEAEKKWAEERQKPVNILNDLQGVGASRGKAVGEALVALSADEAKRIKPGQILVTSMTTPEFVPAMKKAAAIVTDEGGVTCHAAIISRELGVPCVVGTRYATRMLKNGQRVEVAANHGVVRILK